MRSVVAVLALVLLLTLVAGASEKPVVVVAGEGNLEINSDGSAAFGWGWGLSAHSTRVNKHNQTMEMAQNFLKYCPDLQVSLELSIVPDYYVALNREGGIWNLGQSHIMLLNRRKAVLYVAKRMTVKNAVRSTCNAIAEDWEANGRLPVPSTVPTSSSAQDVPGISGQTFTSDQPEIGGSLCGKWFNCAKDPKTSTAAKQDTPSPTANQSAPVRTATSSISAASLDDKGLNTESVLRRTRSVSVEVQRTARAREHCKGDVVRDLTNDIRAYLMKKGVPVGTTSDANSTLMLIIDRPLQKPIELTLQVRDSLGTLLWSETIADNSWKDMGDKEALRALDKIHEIIDTKLINQNGVPSLTTGAK